MNNIQIPLIYCDRRSYDFDTIASSTDIISLWASGSNAGYAWVFAPDSDIEYLDGYDSTDTHVKVRMNSLNGGLSVRWEHADSTIASTLPYDEYMMYLLNEPLVGDRTPQSVYENLVLPYKFNDLVVGINDIAIADNFNYTIKALNDNIKYLTNKSDFIVSRPNLISFRYGAVSDSSPTSADGPNQWQHIESDPWTGDYEHENYASYDQASAMNISHMTTNTSTMMYVLSGDNEIHVSPLKEGHLPIEDLKTYAEFSNDPFGPILDIHLEESGRVWILEKSGRLSKMSYTNQQWIALSVWPNEIINPKQMTIDGDRLYFLSDTKHGAQVVNVYDEFMNDKGTIRSSYITDCMSIVLTAKYLICLMSGTDGLSNNVFATLTKAGEFVRENSVSFAMKKFRPKEEILLNDKLYGVYRANDPYYFFGHTNNLIYKFTEDGAIAGFGGAKAPQLEWAVNGEDDPPLAYTIHGIINDSQNNIYVYSNFDIIKYMDTTVYGQLLLEGSSTTMDKMWTESELFVDQNENCSYFVYNRAFHRLYDNIALLHRSAKGLLATNGLRTFIEPFHIGEFTDLPYSKSDIFVGFNEIHSEGVINRNLTMLYKCLEQVQDIANTKVYLNTNNLNLLSLTTLTSWDGSFSFDGTIFFSGKYKIR